MSATGNTDPYRFTPADEDKAMLTKFVPVTPGGSPCYHIAADTEAQAIANLLEDAAHTPYDGWPGFKARGYTIEKWHIDGGDDVST